MRWRNRSWKTTGKVLSSHRQPSDLVKEVHNALVVSQLSAKKGNCNSKCILAKWHWTLQGSDKSVCKQTRTGGNKLRTEADRRPISFERPRQQLPQLRTKVAKAAVGEPALQPHVAKQILTQQVHEAARSRGALKHVDARRRACGAQLRQPASGSGPALGAGGST